MHDPMLPGAILITRYSPIAILQEVQLFSSPEVQVSQFKKHFEHIFEGYPLSKNPC